MFNFNLIYNQVLYIKAIFIEILNLKLIKQGGSIGNKQQ